MNTTELAIIFRAEIADTAQPYLMPDNLMYLYIDDAQKMFTRLTDGIEDGRSFVLAIQPTVEWYDLDPAILKLRKATDTSTGRPVDVVNIEKAESRGIRFDGRPGPLKALVAGSEKHALRAWPVPSATASVQLDTFRLSRTVAKDDDLEIDDQHQRHLLMWAKYLAYSVQDSELFNARKAAEFEAGFRAYCAAATREQARARHITGTVNYGGC